MPVVIVDEPLQQQLESLTTSAQVRGRNGRVLGRFSPMTPVDGDSDSWTDEKNQRRCDLIDLEIAGQLSDEERQELTILQDEMLQYRRKVAPLPIEELRELHARLMRDASKLDSEGLP